MVRGSLVLMAAFVPAAFGGETAWRQIRAPHVVLRTDLGSGAAREATLAVERYRAEIIAAAWPRATLPANDVIEMTVFGNGLDFERYFGQTITGIFFHELPPHAVMWGSSDRWERRATLATPETNSVLKHELTHHLAASVFRRQPKWFAEGLAQFLETVRPSDDRKSVIIGAVNLEALAKYNRVRSVHIADALRWEGKLDAKDEMSIHGLYGISWMMVHWLFNAHPDQFTQLQVLLSKGIDSEKAWKIIRPSLGAGDLDDALQIYAKHGNYLEFQAPFVEPSAGGFTEKPLGEADVHATRARVALEASRSMTDAKAFRSEGEKEIAAALELEPKNLSAQLLQIRLATPTQRALLARRLVVDHPEEGTAWLMLAETAAPDAKDEVENAIRKAVELLPDNASALNNYAWMLVQRGKAADAAAPAMRAATLAPFEPSILDTLAAVQAALGRCSEARASEARAVDSLPEAVSPEARQRYVKKLTEYETTCVPAGPPAATASTAPGNATSPGTPPANPPVGK
jgi:Flp pilus assembly protein TadD